MGVDRLRLELKCAPELVARVRCVASQRHPVALAVCVLVAAACLDVVLPHETDDVDDIYGHVATAVANAGDRGDSVPRALNPGSGKAMVARQEAQAIRRYLNERGPFPHLSSIAHHLGQSGRPAA